MGHPYFAGFCFLQALVSLTMEFLFLHSSGGIAKEYNYLPLKPQLEGFTTLVIYGYTWIFVYFALLLCVVSSLQNVDSCLSSICTRSKAPMEA
jgi:hypothetical protein